MAGTVVVTERTFGSVKKVIFAWTSDAAGSADGVTTHPGDGVVLRVVQVPGTAGVQPTNAYDIVVNDSDGLDILFGAGANILNTGPTQVNTGLGCVAGGLLTIHVTNAGNAKQGSTIIYMR